jgi:hypothetical protein
MVMIKKRSIGLPGIFMLLAFFIVMGTDDGLSSMSAPEKSAGTEKKQEKKGVKQPKKAPKNLRKKLIKKHKKQEKFAGMWTEVFPGKDLKDLKFDQLSVGEQDEVWAVDVANKKVYQWSSEGWNLRASDGIAVAAGDNFAVYLNQDGALFKSNQTAKGIEWTPIADAPKFSKIAVGSKDQIWGVVKKDTMLEVWRMDAGKGQRVKTDSGKELEGLSEVSVNAQGEAFAIHASGVVSYLGAPNMVHVSMADDEEDDEDDDDVEVVHGKKKAPVKKVAAGAKGKKAIARKVPMRRSDVKKAAVKKAVKKAVAKSVPQVAMLKAKKAPTKKVAEPAKAPAKKEIEPAKAPVAILVKEPEKAVVAAPPAQVAETPKEPVKAPAGM